MFSAVADPESERRRRSGQHCAANIDNKLNLSVSVNDLIRTHCDTFSIEVRGWLGFRGLYSGGHAYSISLIRLGPNTMDSPKYEFLSSYLVEFVLYFCDGEYFFCGTGN